MNRLHAIILVIAAPGLMVGCKREVPAAPVAAKPSRAIARIVFVDKEKCCACTRERIDKSWKALTDVVGYPPVPDVERIHLDSQAAKAAPYTKLRAIVVPPAIYFLDKQGELVEVLQGEVKIEQIKKTLGGKPAA